MLVISKPESRPISGVSTASSLTFSATTSVSVWLVFAVSFALSRSPLIVSPSFVPNPARIALRYEYNPC